MHQIFETKSFLILYCEIYWNSKFTCINKLDHKIDYSCNLVINISHFFVKNNLSN